MDDSFSPSMLQSDNSAPNGSMNALECSICLEAISNNNGRSIANLQCGHTFHLDCIGSEFNVRGLMRCPNCREIEDGNWIFAEGEGPYEQFDEEESEEEEEPEPLPEQPAQLRFGPATEVEARIATEMRANFLPRVFVLTGCAQHCPAAEHHGCASSHTMTSLPDIDLQCQKPVMNIIVNAPTTVAMFRNGVINPANMPNGNGPTAAANGEPVQVLEQLQPVQNPVPLSVVNGTVEHEQEAPPPSRNGPMPQPNENNLESLNMGNPTNETRLPSDDEI